MDPFSGDARYPKSMTKYVGNRGSTARRKFFDKSESEDSGVEMPPSPLGSESSYNPDEYESVESSIPEDHESLASSTPEDCQSLKSQASGKTDHFEQGAVEEQDSSEQSEALGTHLQTSADTMGYIKQEKENSNVPYKLEQAILRSRKQRSSSREAIQNRAARIHRLYPGSLKETPRGKPFSYQARSPVRQSLEKEQDQDALLLPGDGLRYLENLCHMLEQMAELQQRNQRLQLEKRAAEERLRSQVLFLDACVCGDSRDSRDLEQDVTDNPLPNATAWRPQHYRKRSSSHASVLLTLPRQSENTLRETSKVDPQYVSVPNLQEPEPQRTGQIYKAESSQWFKVKDLLSKLSRKGSGPTTSLETRSSFRPPTMLENTTQHPKRLFLPGLVIRPRNHSRQIP